MIDTRQLRQIDQGIDTRIPYCDVALIHEAADELDSIRAERDRLRAMLGEAVKQLLYWGRSFLGDYSWYAHGAIPGHSKDKDAAIAGVMAWLEQQAKPN